MKTVIGKLDTLIDSVSSTIALCGVSKKKQEIIKSLASTSCEIQESISYLQENQKRKFVQVRKALNAVRNVMNGLHEGLVEDEISMSDFRETNRLLATKFFPKIRDGLLAEAELQARTTSEQDDAPIRETSVTEGQKSKIKVVISKSTGLKEALSVVKKSEDTSAAHLSGDAESKLAELARVTREKCPLRITEEFMIIRASVVPIFPSMSLMQAPALERLGLKVVDIEGIIILQNQILLNVSSKRAHKAGTTSLAMAHSVVDLLNERDHTKYEIVSDTPTANPRNADLLMYWVLPRPRMASIMKVLTASRSPALIKWGIPLPDGRADADKARLERNQQRDLPQKRSEEAFLKKKAELEAKKAAERQKAIQHKANLEKRKAQDQARIQDKLLALKKQNLEHRGRLINSKKPKK